MFEQGDKQLCLAFLFPEDQRLADFQNDLAPINGRVQVGCVWTSIECGSRFVAVWPDQGRFAPQGDIESHGNLKIDGYCADLLASASRTFGRRE